MKEKFVNSSIKFITKYQDCDDLKLKQLHYGLEGIYSLIVKLSSVLIISLIMNTWKEVLLIILFYAGIKLTSYGMHAKTNLGCWITTIIIYNIIPIAIKNIIIPKYIGYIVLIISFISMLLWAPADTPKRPLIRKEHRLKCKIISTITVILYSIIFIINKNYLINNTIIYSLIIGSIFINPLTYKITKTKFNNYKYYHKKN